MLSEVASVVLAGNETVCPPGNVLFLDGSEESDARPGQCAWCRSGSYSLHPLVGQGSAQTPSCLTCPAGGRCPGGDVVTFAVGIWSIVNNRWVLDGCPSGYAVTTASAKDECVRCEAKKYSLREGLDFGCDSCPAGGECPGGDVVTFAVGNWSIVNYEWHLDSCPSGYAPNDAGDACVGALRGPTLSRRASTLSARRALLVETALRGGAW